MNLLISLIFMCLSSLVFGAQDTMKSYHSEGKKFVKESEMTKPKNTNKVPGYGGTKIPEAKYNDNNLNQKTAQAINKSQEANFMTESFNNRPKFEIDPQHDPLITNANDIVENPERQGGFNLTKSEVAEQGGTKTRHQCERGQDSVNHKCTRRLVPKKTGTKREDKEYIVNFKGKDMYNHSRVLYDLADEDQYYARSKGIRPKSPSVIQALKSLGKIVDVVSGQTIDIKLDNVTAVHHVKDHGKKIEYSKKKKGHWTHTVEGKMYKQYRVVWSVEIPTYELKWVNDCEALEKLLDRGDCEYGESRCIESGQTKVIDGMTYTAPCWAEERTYRCHSTIKDTCRELLEKGCHQVTSRCKAYEENECIKWEQTFECDHGPRHLGGTSLSGEKPFCLDGDCTEQSWAPNADMAEALSKLAIFQKIQKDMNGTTKTIFNGEKKKCSRATASFKDCCVKKGWGMQVGLASCKQKEKELSEERKRHKCIQIGTYCAKRELGICLSKKTSFCCYSSRLARIINEQGKKQLKLKFGSPEHPQCEGLTVEQLTSLDFSKIDLSELFEEIMSNLKIPNVNQINQGIQKSMEDRTRMYTNKPEKITQGRAHGNF